MKKLISLLIFVAFLTLAFTSCKNSDSPLSPTEQNFGFIKGKVHSRTEITDVNSTDTIDYFGFAVRINGTSHTLITDSTGYWFFGNIPEGIYSISFSKAGYSNYIQTGAAVKKNDTLDYAIYIYKYTNSRMNNLSYELTPSSLKLDYNLSVAVQRDYYVRFYFSLDSNVGNPISNYTYSEADLLLNVTTPLSSRTYYAELVHLYQNGFSHGNRVYLYGNTAYKNQYYTDSISGRRVYNANSEFPTQKLSFTLP